MKPLYITTPIYYVNGKPHIGHAYTTIACDIYARYFKLRSRDVFFLTGTDEHGNKIEEAAVNEKKEVQAFCDEYAQYFKHSWELLNISFDDFIRTTQDRHIQSVNALVTLLYEKGDIYEGKYEGLYCTGCEKFMTEKDLVDGMCPFHKRAPEFISEKNYFFKLSKYLPKLKELIENDTIHIQPQERKNEVLGFFKQDLEDFSVSREHVKWGIPVPFDASQVLYVWPDALTNYISAIGYAQNQEQFGHWWNQSQVIHVMSKDILKFHAIYWPALLLAADIKVPDMIFTHGFFTIDGQKMSKTLGNVIDPNELVSTYGSDATRYLIVSQFPFGLDGNIKKDEFTHVYNTVLANNLGNLISRTTAMTQNYAQGMIDSIPQDIGIESYWQRYHEYMEQFSFFHALKVVHELLQWCNTYIEEQKPWELAKQQDTKRVHLVLSTVLECICHINYMLFPILPNTCQSIMSYIPMMNIRDTKKITWGIRDTTKQVQKSVALFSRMEK